MRFTFELCNFTLTTFELGICIYMPIFLDAQKVGKHDLLQPKEAWVSEAVLRLPTVELTIYSDSSIIMEHSF